jgi:hypothetical protein
VSRFLTFAPTFVDAWERRVFIFGSRPPTTADPAVWAAYWSMLDQVDALVDELPPDVLVISGGARGTDQRAQRRSIDRGLAFLCCWPMGESGVYRVRYSLTPAGEKRPAYVWWAPRPVGTWAIAAHQRNGVMVDLSTEAHGFWFGGSLGTGHAIELAERAGKLRTRIEL